MPKFKVTLKRVVYAEIELEAATAQQARQQVEDSAEPMEYFNMSNSIGTDTVTVSKVERIKESAS